MNIWFQSQQVAEYSLLSVQVALPALSLPVLCSTAMHCMAC